MDRHSAGELFQRDVLGREDQVRGGEVVRVQPLASVPHERQETAQLAAEALLVAVLGGIFELVVGGVELIQGGCAGRRLKLSSSFASSASTS